MKPIPREFPYNTVDWMTGEIFELTHEVDYLVNIARNHNVEEAIRAVVPDDLFKQQQVRDEYARWIYRGAG